MHMPYIPRNVMNKYGVVVQGSVSGHTFASHQATRSTSDSTRSLHKQYSTVLLSEFNGLISIRTLTMSVVKMCWKGTNPIFSLWWNCQVATKHKSTGADSQCNIFMMKKRLQVERLLNGFRRAWLATAVPGELGRPEVTRKQVIESAAWEFKSCCWE